MEITTLQEGTPTVIALVGRLDTNTSPMLDEFAKNLYDGGAHDIVVDMTDCDYVSSAGLRVIVAMQKRAVVDGSLVFRSVQPTVADVFSMTGFDSILTIE